MKVVRFAVPLSNDSIIMEEDVLPYFYNYFHQHDEMQITLIVRGEGTLIIDNYTQRFSAGDIYFIAANQPHIFRSDQSYFENEKSDSVSAIHLYFDANSIFNNLPEMEQVLHFIRNVNYGMQIPQANAAEVKERMGQIAATHGLPRLLKFLDLLDYLSINLKEYTSLSSGKHTRNATLVENIRINKIYQYTQEHYAEDISLENIAALCYMTPQAFCRYFKKHTSKTYMTFLQETRISAACEKMIRGQFEGISSIAFATGFNSAINFNKVFKKIAGITPGEYMKKYKRA